MSWELPLLIAVLVFGVWYFAGWLDEYEASLEDEEEDDQ